MTLRNYIVALLISLLATQHVSAAALPVTSTQNAVSGVLQAKMVKRGFAQNDPRFASTLQAAGAAIAGAAASAAVVTAVGITAPAWVTAGLVVGLGVLFSYGINLAVDGVKWLLNSNGTVTVGDSDTPAGVGLYIGGPYWAVGNAFGMGGEGASYGDGTVLNGTSYGTTPELANQAAMRNGGGHDMTSWKFKCDPISGPSNSLQTRCFWDLGLKYADGSSYWQEIPTTYYSSGSPVSSPTGAYNGGTFQATGTDLSKIKLNVPDAVAALSAAEKTKPVNPALIATLADNAWKNAASQPGYNGLPYQATDPITTAEAQAWRDANPANWPTIGDVVAPQPAPAGGNASTPFTLPNFSQPVSSVDTNTGSNTGTNPSTQPQINLGIDPGIGAPGLETIPSAQAILAPIINVMPSLKSFVVPNHNSTCPKPSAAIFGKQVILEAHCELAESARPTLYAVMGFVWLILAMFIVLRA